MVTCAPTSYHFLVESFDYFDPTPPRFENVDFRYIYLACDFLAMNVIWLDCNHFSRV